MVHVRALPGTPAYAGETSTIIETAVKEAELLRAAGVDGILLENMHDNPYLNRNVGPEITAMMAVIGRKVREVASLPVGVQILAGANKAALAVALAADLQFIRVEGFVFLHIADEGQMDSDAASLLRYRRQIGADRILVLTDIKKKHSSHAITADVGLDETAKAAEFFRSDGLVITGTSTGAVTEKSDIDSARNVTGLPVLAGSGVTATNLDQYFHCCDGVIVGSTLKRNGHWANELDPGRVQEFVDKLNSLRQGR